MKDTIIHDNNKRNLETIYIKKWKHGVKWEWKLKRLVHMLQVDGWQLAVMGRVGWCSGGLELPGRLCCVGV